MVWMCFSVWAHRRKTPSAHVADQAWWSSVCSAAATSPESVWIVPLLPSVPLTDAVVSVLSSRCSVERRKHKKGCICEWSQIWSSVNNLTACDFLSTFHFSQTKYVSFRPSVTTQSHQSAQSFCTQTLSALLRYRMNPCVLFRWMVRGWAKEIIHFF